MKMEKKMLKECWYILILIGFLIAGKAVAAPPDFAHDLVRYLGIEKNAENEELAKLVELKSKAEAPDLTADQRKLAYVELFKQMAKIQGSNPPQPLMEGMAQWAVSFYCPGNPVPAVSHRGKPGEIPAVIRQGRGDLPMILIPDAGFDGRVFQSFLERNASHYRMYAVTLPGFGGTAALPRFEPRDYAQLRLWKNAEDSVLSLIRKEQLKKVVLVGHQAGAYLALRMSLDHPELIRAAVILNGLLYAPMQTSKDPSGKVTMDLRLKIAKVFLPIELLPIPTHECLVKSWLNTPGLPANDAGRQLAEIAATSDRDTVWDYSAELFTTDLTDEIPKLKVPVLVVPAVSAPAQSSKTSAELQWSTVASPLLKVTPIENAGPFVLQENPTALDRLILEFLSKP